MTGLHAATCYKFVSLILVEKLWNQSLAVNRYVETAQQVFLSSLKWLFLFLFWFAAHCSVHKLVQCSLAKQS